MQAPNYTSVEFSRAHNKVFYPSYSFFFFFFFLNAGYANTPWQEAKSSRRGYPWSHLTHKHKSIPSNRFNPFEAGAWAWTVPALGAARPQHPLVPKNPVRHLPEPLPKRVNPQHRTRGGVQERSPPAPSTAARRGVRNQVAPQPGRRGESGRERCWTSPSDGLAASAGGCCPGRGPGGGGGGCSQLQV